MHENNKCIPRNEYPRPQFIRENWLNLNGEWDFEFDFSNSGIERKLYEKADFSKKILVPFCPESELSGIGFKDFITACWYKKEIYISKDKLDLTSLLHFGAVDYKSIIWINGKEAFTHIGGYSSFTIDISKYLVEGENTIVVYAYDDSRNPNQVRGKQSRKFNSFEAEYTRTTGIWQTVWLEFVSNTYLKNTKLSTDINNSMVHCNLNVIGDLTDLSIRLVACFEGKVVGTYTSKITELSSNISFSVNELHLWEVGAPNLYDLTYELIRNDEVIDKVDSYFGMRTVTFKNNIFHLNNKPLFQRLVLDQGFYPDGIYTAPTEAALLQDIKLSMDLGFNGARLHQKVFEERFLYLADKLGYLVWGEMGDWGFHIDSMECLSDFLPAWLEVLERDFNHPSIITWCPLNETFTRGKGYGTNVPNTIYDFTKIYDPTRPCVDVSGGYHVKTDVYDLHDYEQNVEVFTKRYDSAATEYYDCFTPKQKYNGEPYFISEYGGAWWAPNEKDGWGYGAAPKEEEEFATRYEGLTGALMDCSYMSGFCYTQLYDVEQEKNGLLTYDRKPKFTEETYAIIRKTNSKLAKVENLN